MGDEMMEIGYQVPKDLAEKWNGLSDAARREAIAIALYVSGAATNVSEAARAAKLSRGGMGDLMDRIGVAIRPN
ncbi:MAG: hypothetical protein ACR2JW_09180 [Thermomicrobiales bacterium]